jgi:AraC-like DNA-binding protein
VLVRDGVVLFVGSQLELPLEARRYLGGHYRVVEVSDDIAAMVWVQGNIPDLIIANLATPRIDGRALCRAIVNDRVLTSVSILLLASTRSNEGRFAALREGADDCLAIPIDVRLFGARVDNLMARSRRIRACLAKPAPVSTLLAPLAPNNIEDGTNEIIFLKQVEDTIDANLDNEQFNVHSLARSVATGRANLYRQLKTCGNISPAKLILERRLQRAASLLANDRATVTEVAYTVGFKSLAHFSRSFRKHLGMAPRAYLKGQESKKAATSRPLG